MAVAGKFMSNKGTTAKFRFDLLARNGQVVATKEWSAAEEAHLSPEGHGRTEVLDGEQHLRPY